MITEADGRAIAAAAQGWLNTPHVNNAKVKGVGVDCGMLLIGALEDAGVIKKDEIAVKPYSNEWHLHHSEEWFLFYVQTYCDKITLRDLRPGDFLLYQYGRCVSHAAVYCGKDAVCHALVGQGVVLSDINDVMFYDARGRSRLRGVYRYRGGV